jgi:transposase
VAAPPDIDVVVARLDAGERVAAIASDFGVTERTVRNWLHRAGLPLASDRRRDRRLGLLADPVWLRGRYVDDEQSVSTIAHHLSVPTTAVRDALDDETPSR